MAHAEPAAGDEVGADGIWRKRFTVFNDSGDEVKFVEVSGNGTIAGPNTGILPYGAKTHFWATVAYGQQRQWKAVFAHPSDPANQYILTLIVNEGVPEGNSAVGVKCDPVGDTNCSPRLFDETTRTVTLETTR